MMACIFTVIILYKQAQCCCICIDTCQKPGDCFHLLASHPEATLGCHVLAVTSVASLIHDLSWPATPLLTHHKTSKLVFLPLVLHLCSFSPHP